MPNKTPQKAAQKEYVQLSQASLTSTDTHNFYAVITDATFPYRVSADRYICSLRVIDPSLNSKTKGGSAQVVIYAKRFEDLPIVHRVGDVIRVNRANYRMYNNVKQFNANVYYKSSWALYSTDKTTPLGGPAGTGAYAHSGAKSSFSKRDAGILETLKKWSASFCSANNVGDSGVVALKNASKQSNQFDCVARILQVFELDDYTNELKLRDASGETYYALALKVKFPHLSQGAAVRIRSAANDDQATQKSVLNLQHYSNIMTFTSSSKVAKDLAKVGDDRAADGAALKGGKNLRVCLTEVDKKHAGLANTNLKELFGGKNTAQTTFRTCFYVAKAEPGNLADACQVYDKKTKKFSSAASGKGDLVHRVQFLAKDASTQFDNNVYRVLLYTHEGLGSNFFGKAANLHKDAAALKKLTGQVGHLTRFNSWVDAVVERRNGYFFIKDTRMLF